jgi:hypothetical protein
MELQYEKAMQEHGLKVSDLNKDGRVGVEQINKALRAMALNEKKGKKATPSTLQKIKTMDKWVYYEILDMMEGTDENEDEIPYDGDDVIEDLNKNARENDEDEQNEDLELDEEEADDEDDEEDTKPKEAKGDGSKINEELKALYESGVREITIDELKSKAKNTYDAIYYAYEEDDENGVATKEYTLIEKEKQKYTLNKL